MAERDWNLVKAFVVGGLIGAAIGILFAPKSGKETRQDISLKADELLSKAREEYEKASEKGRAAYEAATVRARELEGLAREKAGEISEKVSELAAQSTEKLAEGSGRLKKAFDAGVEAYREEKNKI
ncbi:MAG: YtxH domain-containing protein [Smithellaceae bacterium]|jgi:gas vesicle protein|nr:YtxH domain-containing protein [Smithellaceae bacterium]MDD3259043.1 YtxH domain-containing protein [Smithellaceae bacterium]MDD3847814.1 YtxH domain-containing protein [Smithellaceae bacterium]HOG13098.1 YtxH domain-containing protein [Smithellaceae bacterium]HOQ71849.1 YtxH domain-containing protein [Smithellaceae bacterium]